VKRDILWSFSISECSCLCVMDICYWLIFMGLLALGGRVGRWF